MIEKFGFESRFISSIGFKFFEMVVMLDLEQGDMNRSE